MGGIASSLETSEFSNALKKKIAGRLQLELESPSKSISLSYETQTIVFLIKCH